jgi:hypothetical protein
MMKTRTPSARAEMLDIFFRGSDLCRQIWVVVFLLFFTMTSNAVGWQSVPAIKIEKGPLNQIADSIGDIIRLQWDGDHIELNRDWPEIDEKERMEMLVQSFVDRGMDQKTAEQFAGRQRGGFGNDHPLDSQFELLANSIGASTSGGGGNEQREYRFNNRRISGNYRRNKETVELEFREVRDTGQRFMFCDRDGKSLSLLFLSEGIIIDFRQTETGQIRLGIIEEEPHLYVADNYRSLVNGQPEVATLVLRPLFSHIGIVPPHTEDSPEILRAMMTQLVAMADSDGGVVNKLIETLDSTRDSKARKDAVRQLTDGFEHWQSSITRFSKEETLSDESKKTLKQILANENRQGPRQFVNENGLMAKPAIFIGMLNERGGEEKKLVLAHLKSLTQQDFGDDIQAWKEWSRKQ